MWPVIYISSQLLSHPPRLADNIFSNRETLTSISGCFYLLLNEFTVVVWISAPRLHKLRNSNSPKKCGNTHNFCLRKGYASF